jgi:hypothetical protein
MMANPNPILRDEAQELKRQINFAKTHRSRVFEKAQLKVAEYDEKIARLTEKLAEVEPS